MKSSVSLSNCTSGLGRLQAPANSATKTRREPRMLPLYAATFGKHLFAAKVGLHHVQAAPVHPESDHIGPLSRAKPTHAAGDAPHARRIAGRHGYGFGQAQ